jgi:hypothetical protein
LVVAVCHQHKRYFTVYPPGLVPYGRQVVVEAEVMSTIVEVAPVTVAPVKETPAVPVQHRSADQQRTIFWSAVSAAEADLWSEETSSTHPCGQTQRRHIRRCAQWLGLGEAEDRGEQVAALLRIPLSTHRAARQEYRRDGKRQGQGAVVVALLDAIQVDGHWWRAMLQVGELTGMCGRAWEVADGGVLARVSGARRSSLRGDASSFQRVERAGDGVHIP